MGDLVEAERSIVEVGQERESVHMVVGSFETAEEAAEAHTAAVLADELELHNWDDSLPDSVVVLGVVACEVVDGDHFEADHAVAGHVAGDDCVVEHHSVAATEGCSPEGRAVELGEEDLQDSVPGVLCIGQQLGCVDCNRWEDLGEDQLAEEGCSHLYVAGRATRRENHHVRAESRLCP